MQIAYFERINSFLACSGQPRPEHFSDIQAAGYETVINLSSHDTIGYLKNEKELVENNGMKYIHLPVQWDDPQLYDALKFFALMNASRNNRVWVHCNMNMISSYFIYVYRVHILKESEELARPILNKYCEITPSWQEFLDQIAALHAEIG